MNLPKPEKPASELVLEYELDAPPEKVWRAISVPALRERWLPDLNAGEGAEPVALIPGEEVSYRLRDEEPPFLESAVTLRVRPNATGGCTLTIVHRLTDARLQRRADDAANDGGTPVMLAA